MKKLFVLLCALITVLALAACGAPAPTTAPTTEAPATEAPATEAPATSAATQEPTASPEPAASPVAGITVTDLMGETVTLAAAPQRIVSLTPSNTETLFALGLGDKIVGVDAVSNYPAEVANIEKVGDFNGPDLEKVASLKPDLVLAGNKLQKDIIDKLKALNLTVAAVEATTYAETYDSIALIGKLTSTDDKAKTLTDDMRRKEQIVTDAIKGKTTDKSAYVCISYGQFGDYSAGPGSFPYEMIDMLGAKSITKDMPVPWPQMTLEAIVKADPSVVLLSSDLGAPADFASAEGYKDLTASKGNQVFTVTSDTCMRPGPRIVDGLREFAQILYGVTISFD